MALRASRSEWAETYHVEGVQVGISGYVTDWLASCIEDVVERGDPDLFKQMRLAALNDGMTVYGEIIVRLWRSRSRTYPTCWLPPWSPNTSIPLDSNGSGSAGR